MIAILQAGEKLDGFSQNKEYEYFDQYDIGDGTLTFWFRSDDNGRQRKISEREFINHFYGRYSDMPRYKEV